MTEFSPEELFFFNDHPQALALYRPLRGALLRAAPEVRIEVKKTQISFFARRMFAAASFLPVRRAKDRPKTYLTLTLGLPFRIESPRIDAVSEPYPGRWTHHLLLSRTEEFDEELLRWIDRAAEFASQKR